MKTYEGTFTVKWHKNDRGSTRPITIDSENKEEMQAICNAIRKTFLEKGECPQVADTFGTHRLIGVPVMSAKFNISERK